MPSRLSEDPKGIHERTMRARVSTGQILAIVLFLVLPAGLSTVSAQDPAAPRALRWGGDLEGGGPYIFPDQDNSRRLVGFEVELATALARKLGRPGHEFVQCQWDSILAQLSREDFEIALNGYEFTPERASAYRATIPYYIYELRLCVHRNRGPVNSWESLAQPHGGQKLRVGVLEGSAADRYISLEFAESCVPVRLSGTVESLIQLEQGQLDATVQDGPMLQFFIEQQRRHPDLTIVPEPRQEGYYVMYTRPADSALCDALNQALRELYDSGELQSIYERYGIWNPTQTKLPAVWSNWKSGLLLSRKLSWRNLGEFLPDLLDAAQITVLLSCLSMPLAVAIGLFVALGRSWSTPILGGESGGWWFRIFQGLLTLYVEVVRGTPLAFQLFVVYFVLPAIGFRIHEFWAGVMALAMNYSAYESEIFRLGLQAIPRGQMEAALSLGMPRTLAVRRIILPQVVRMVIPATANDFIALFKDTAVCAVIGVVELSKRYSIDAKNNTTLFFELAALTGVLYLLMSYPLSLLAAWLERTLKRAP